MEGFVAAIAGGVRSFETDVAVTRDGVAVLHHDPALNPDIARGPDGRWLDGAGPLLHDLLAAELAAYDVGRIRPGTDYARRYPDQVPRDGARIPRLLDVLRLPGVRWNIELKLFPGQRAWTVPPEEMADRVLRDVAAAGAADRVTIQSFDWRAPRYVRCAHPGIATGWLTRAETVRAPRLWWDLDALPDDDAGIPDRIAAEGGGTWTPFHAELTQPSLARAHALGLRVVPWTVNDPADMACLVAGGVDGLITDRPDLAPVRR